MKSRQWRCPIPFYNVYGYAPLSLRVKLFCSQREYLDSIPVSPTCVGVTLKEIIFVQLVKQIWVECIGWVDHYIRNIRSHNQKDGTIFLSKYLFLGKDIYTITSGDKMECYNIEKNSNKFGIKRIASTIFF